jgi:hypothetical protein
MHTSVVPFFYVFFAIVLGLGWAFARRRLSEKEFKAWQWRERHPYALWFRSCLGMLLLFELLCLTVAYLTDSSMSGLLDVENQFVALLMATMIATLAFSFWYWNGVALYRARLLTDRSLDA